MDKFDPRTEPLAALRERHAEKRTLFHRWDTSDPANPTRTDGTQNLTPEFIDHARTMFRRHDRIKGLYYADQPGESYGSQDPLRGEAIADYASWITGQMKVAPPWMQRADFTGPLPEILP